MLSLFPSVSSFQVPLSSGLLTGTFLLLFAFWVVHMVIVRYHWSKYGNDRLKVVRMNVYYLTGSAILFTALAFFLVAFTTSVSVGETSI